MKKLFYLFMALLLSQQLIAQTKTWNGSVSTDWYTAGNWTPSNGATAGAPTASDNVVINIASPDPIIGSGNALAKSVSLDVVGSALTINSSATLTVSASSGKVVSVIGGTLTNNGTLSITNSNGSYVVGNESLSLTSAGTVTNTGTITINGGLNVGISVIGSTFNNQTGGNVTSNGRDVLRMGSMGTSFTNASGATLTGTGSNNGLFVQPGTVTNSGTLDVTGQSEFYNNALLTNNACGKIKLTGDFFNQTGSTTANAGFLHVTGALSNNGSATNTGVLKFSSLSGTFSNSGNASVRVNNTPTPIFTYGGTYNGTINGIFTNPAATTSAGTFTAPNTFVGANTLPVGSQTLYAKITPSGGACEYIVPFTYVYTPPPSFTTHPANVAVCSGTPTSFTVAANDATGYQWQISTNSGSTWNNLSNNSTYSNVTTTTLNISSSAGLGSSIYRCVATGPGGSTNSNSASITLNPSTTPSSAGTITWVGSISNDWNTPCNWSPGSVPTANNDVVIPNTTNDPVIANGITATTGYLTLNSGAVLTVNTGGTLNVRGKPEDGMMLTSATFTNNGTTDIQRPGGLPFSSGGIYAAVGSTVNNSGTLTVNASVSPISNGSTSLAVNNNTGGVLNVINGNAFTSIGGSTNLNITNDGIINVNCTTMSGFKLLTNNGTVNINGGGIEVLSAKTVTNNVCGKIYVNAGDYSNNGTTTNFGLIQIVNELAIGSGFANRGVLKYGTLSGTVTNTTTAAVIVKDSPIPIFTYGGASFSGTVDGIFTNAGATTSAGTFTAPNTFEPSGSLPLGSQTLYAKITPSGGACSYIVPFIYIVLPTFTTQPVNTTACSPQATSFTVAATSATSLQWQISTDAGSTWTNITASAIYTNVTTATLNISNTAGLNGNQYRCVATNVGGSVNSNAATLTVITGVSTPTGTLTWTGAVSTNWNLACNWSPASVPGAGNDVVIPNTTNDPVIGAGTAALAKTVEIQTGALFTIAATGSITVNGSKTVSSVTSAFDNNGTVNNSGLITIGNTTSSGAYGIVNRVTFNNNAGGEIKVDNATSGGIYGRTGSTFTNAAKITLGSVSAIAGNGIFNDETFNNNAGGEIKIDQITGSGIFNRTGTFNNAAKITIGSVSPITGSGILNDDTFNNITGGEIAIESTTSSGFYNRGGTFTNAALLTIGTSGTGLLNRAALNNQNCAKVIVEVGSLLNDTGGNYTNQGYTEVAGSLNNSVTFTNNGTLKYGSLTGTVTNNTAPSVIVNNNPANNAVFTYGGAYNGTINGIFTNATATTSAGTFTAPNTFAPSGALPAGSQTLYAKITPSGGACFYVVPFTYVVATPAPSFTTQPTNVSVCAGTATSFTVAATNAASYQWQISTNSGSTWTNITASAIYTNVTTTTLNISNVTGLNGNQYRCVATGPGGNTNSNAATLLVSPANLTLVSTADDINTNAGTKQATQTITATNKLTAPAVVSYRAGNAITLNPGFLADNGVIFLTQLAGCN